MEVRGNLAQKVHGHNAMVKLQLGKNASEHIATAIMPGP